MFKHNKEKKSDDDYIIALYQEIYSQIQENCTNFNENSDLNDWVNLISDPKYKLFHNLIIILEKSEINFVNKEKIFKIFNYILQINSKISAQLLKYNSFPKIIIDYIISYNNIYHKVFVDAVNTLSFIFILDKYRDLISFQLISILFDSLSLIGEQNVLENVIFILIEINSTFSENEKNYFLEEYEQNKNSRIFNDTILILLNQTEDKNRLTKILLCIKYIMLKEQKNFFNQKDLEIFMDITLRNFETTFDNEIRTAFLDVLLLVTKFNEFYNIMYKTKELQDILDDFLKNDKLDKIIKGKCKKILKHIIKYLKMQLIMKTNYSGFHLDDFDEDLIKDSDDDEEEEEEEEEEKEDKKEEIKNS